MNRFFKVLGIFLLVHLSSFAQETFPVNGVHDERLGVYAFTNANVVVSPGTMLEGATLLINDGRVVAVGKQVEIPSGAIEYPMDGKYIYPSFIDPYTNYGMPAVGKPEYGRRPQYKNKIEGAYNWNEAIKSFYESAEDFKPESKTAEALRKSGFGTVLAFRPDGIARGTSLVVNLSDDEPQKVFVKKEAAAHYSFKKGSSAQAYPSSQMGAIALLKQTYLDAQWYDRLNKKEFHDLALEAFNDKKSLPQIFEVDDLLEIFRADRIGDEFGVQYIMKGSGEEYKRVEAIKSTNAPLIIPVNFPEAFDVEDPYDAMNVSLADMKHWEMAPANAGILEKAEVPFAFTTYELEKKEEFLNNVRKAVENGLSEDAALRALTQYPAELLNIQGQAGTLEKGKQANFLIASDNIFEKEAVIYQNWVNGQLYEINPLDLTNYAGVYNLKVGDETYELHVSGKPSAHETKIVKNDTTDIKVKSSFKDELVTFSFNPEDMGDIRLSGWAEDKNLKGEGQLPNGEWVKWMADYQGEEEAEDKKELDEEKDSQNALGQVIYPFLAHGYQEIPEAQTILIKNATVWTNEEQGILENADVLVKGGKIVKVGKNLGGNADLEIDGTGKHLTTGIVDEHSHIAISKGVNEAGQSVTAEVSIGNVVNSEDINIYRQLAGGVTAAQLLHGSANPIGGQSALIKLKWGRTPEEMKIDNTDGFIKFALGENVKQSNWGEGYTQRFPQTRMGVEQVIMNAFTRAKEYEAEHKAYNGLSKRKKKNTVAPRKDLEMETLLEILNQERFVTSHSYVQSEINMLMKTAEALGFRINTFTHILEGYKVADKMKEHGVGGSTFADWWAYKFEVRDAIPYNAVLMNNMGIITAINSDDAEMGRRLNQEAAKMVKYGNMSEEEAWKLITLNPAKLLHLDNRLGSIKAGKDADLVLWSANPLSVYAQVEKTIIEGAVYYDQQKDKEQREYIRKERARLTQKMREAETNGNGQKKEPKPSHQHLWHCDDY